MLEIEIVLLKWNAGIKLRKMKRGMEIRKGKRSEAGNVKMMMTTDEIDHGIGVKVTIVRIELEIEIEMGGGIEIEMGMGIEIELMEGMRGIEREKEMIEVAVVIGIAVEMVEGIAIGIKIAIGTETAAVEIDQETSTERGKKEVEVMVKEIEREVEIERSRTDGKGATLKNIVMEETRIRRKVVAGERKEETQRMILTVVKIDIAIGKVEVEKAGKGGHPLKILAIIEMTIEVKKLIKMVIKKGLEREMKGRT
jgi:hypothetical protein